jgi:transforming growth factor-beta-induced protein
MMINWTKRISMLLLFAVALFTFSCEKENQIGQETMTLNDIEQFLGVEINDLNDFPKYRDLSDEEVERILNYLYGKLGLDENGQPVPGAISFRSDNDISLFEIAVIRVRMIRAVIRGEYTIFAPVNSVFESLGLTDIGTIFAFPEDQLQTILSYHILNGRLFAADLQSKFYPTLLGPAVEINTMGSVTVNNIDVVAADTFSPVAFNSVIHRINGLLVPPSENIVEIAIGFANSPNPEFTQLVAAVVKAELAGTLSGEGPFTVFAPTDAAFAALLGALGASSIDDVEVGLLTQVLLYHVVPGRVFSTDLANGPVQTLNGPITIDVDNLTIADTGTTNLANLIASLLNVQGSNGVIHVIDKVLLP